MYERSEAATSAVGSLLGCSVVLVLLAGCGVTTPGSTAGTGNTATSTTSTNTTPVGFVRAATSSAQNVSWPTTPAVVVTTQSQRTATIKVGADPGDRTGLWQPLGAREGCRQRTSFTLNAPAGYPDDQLSACVSGAALLHRRERGYARGGLHALGALCTPQRVPAEHLVEFTVSIAATN